MTWKRWRYLFELLGRSGLFNMASSRAWKFSNVRMRRQLGPVRSSCGRLTLHASDNLSWIDEAQRNQQPHQCGEHVDYRHGVDRLPRSHARRIDRVIERDHERLTPGPRREECQLEHRYCAHQYEQ